MPSSSMTSALPLGQEDGRGLLGAHAQLGADVQSNGRLLGFGMEKGIPRRGYQILQPRRGIPFSIP